MTTFSIIFTLLPTPYTPYALRSCLDNLVFLIIINNENESQDQEQKGGSPRDIVQAHKDISQEQERIRETFKVPGKERIEVLQKKGSNNRIFYQSR